MSDCYVDSSGTIITRDPHVLNRSKMRQLEPSVLRRVYFVAEALSDRRGSWMTFAEMEAHHAATHA